MDLKKVNFLFFLFILENSATEEKVENKNKPAAVIQLSSG
jgi:hypothetical protein